MSELITKVKNQDMVGLKHGNLGRYPSQQSSLKDELDIKIFLK
jgi:hypothetical protein